MNVKEYIENSLTPEQWETWDDEFTFASTKAFMKRNTHGQEFSFQYKMSGKLGQD